jgi:general secretion pathway protein K
MVTTAGHKGGFALVAVLWILVAVGAVGVAFQAAARTERQVAANNRTAVRARWAARAGLARQLAAIDQALKGLSGVAGISSTGDTVMPVRRFAVGAVAVEVVALDARSRVNLNLADGEMLMRLFRVAGLGRRASADLAGAILDRRDPAARGRARGADASRNAALAAAHLGSRSGAFGTREELAEVVGMDWETYQRVAPYVGVVGDGRINVNSAPLPVLQTLPGIDAVAARAIVGRRQLRPFRSVYDLVAALPKNTQRAISAVMDRLEERIAFYPRDLEVIVSADGRGSVVGSSLSAAVHLAGQSVKELDQVVER